MLIYEGFPFHFLLSTYKTFTRQIPKHVANLNSISLFIVQAPYLKPGDCGILSLQIFSFYFTTIFFSLYLPILLPTIALITSECGLTTLRYATTKMCTCRPLKQIKKITIELPVLFACLSNGAQAEIVLICRLGTGFVCHCKCVATPTLSRALGNQTNFFS